MTPRDRVNKALAFERPDRTPRDFAAVPEIWQRLGLHFGTSDRGEILRKLGVDCRVVSYDGFCRRPAAAPDPGGGTRDIWGAHRTPVVNTFGVLDEFASFPLASAEDVDDLKRYPWPRPDWWDFSDIRSAISAVNNATRFHIRYRIGSVFETAWSLFGFEKMLMDLLAQPALPVYAMERIVEVHLENLRAVLETAGDLIDMVYFYDDLASQAGLLMSPALYSSTIGTFHQRIFDMARRYGKPVMMHCCGSIYALIPLLMDMGLAILNPIQPSARNMEPERLAREFGGRLAFHGGIDVQQFLPRATPEQVREKVAWTCETLGGNGGYILAGSHHFQADTSIENILAIYE